MSATPDTGENRPKIRTEELRSDILSLIEAYPVLTMAEICGVLELVKHDMLERWRETVPRKPE